MRKRNLFFYIGFSVAAALLIVGTVLAFLSDEYYYLGIIGAVALAADVIALATVITRDNLNIKCGKLCDEKRYNEEKALIEQKMKSPFFFLVRTVALLRYVRVNMALDDLPTAKRYIDTLRHGGGLGWKYMTAYSYILIKLDEGDIVTARTEYEEFRTQCAHAEIYREQIEVLRAIFHRLFKTNNTEPLPAAAMNSPFPIVSRVLGRTYEERAAEYAAAWSEE